MFHKQLTLFFLFGKLLICSTQINNTNIALNKSVNQSSNYVTANLANDGNTSTCSQTDAEALPWWYVELGNVYRVDYIQIYKNGSETNLMDVEVRVVEPGGSVLSSDQICGNLSSQTSTSGDYYHLNCNLKGNIVSLYRPSVSTLPLTLCDVQVYANFITCPDNIMAVTASSDQSVAVSWDSPVIVDDTYMTSCSQSSGSMFSGQTTVFCSASISNDLVTYACAFTVKVTVQGEDESPKVICPGNIVIGTNGNQATVAWDDALVSDNIDTDLSATCAPSSGSSFSAGSTNVTCTATDNTGNVGSCIFSVDVKEQDDLSPSLTCPDPTSQKFVMTWDDPLVTDNIDADLSATCTPSSGSSFSPGSTDVACTATDSAGNEGSCQFSINLGESMCNSSGSSSNIAVTIVFCLIIVVISTLLIVYCRSYYSVMKKLKNLQKEKMDYEVPMKTAVNTQSGRNYEVNIPDAKVPPTTSEEVNSGYEELHPYMSVDHPFTDLKK